MAIGTTVEMTRFGDLKSINSEEQAQALYEAGKFRRLKQYDSILLQRKNDRAQISLAFSFVRNGIQLGFLPRAQRTAIQREINDSTIKPDKRIAQHLSVFNGLKGLCMLMMVWGFTFYFAWYSVISNPEDMDSMSNTLLFNVVSMCVYTVPVFFFCSGFL